MAQFIIFGAIVVLISVAVFKASSMDLHPDIETSEEEIKEELDWHPHDQAQ
jgi:hypothetical protein